jgi:hypothetical protein
MAGSMPRGWKDYLPLLVIVAVAVLVASAKQADYGVWRGARWMDDFMGFYFAAFSMVKLFDLPGFAKGFQTYDLLAGRFRPYAYLYPFIELGLGLGYLARWRPAAVYGATVAVMAWGAVGIARALAKGPRPECACMGTALKVPLSAVTLLENAAMAAMAGGMLAMTR